MNGPIAIEALPGARHKREGLATGKSLYDPNIATMEGETSRYDQSDATEFIRLSALRLELRVAMRSNPPENNLPSEDPLV